LTRRGFRSVVGRRVEMTGRGTRTYHNDELHNLYFSPDFMTTINPRRIRWLWHVPLMGAKNGLGETPQGKSSFELVPPDGVKLI
jgi:hypothetical protein